MNIKLILVFLIISSPIITIHAAEVKTAAAEAIIAEENERSGETYLKEVLTKKKLPMSLFGYYRSKEVPVSLRKPICEVLKKIDFSENNWSNSENDHVEIIPTLSGKVFTLKQIPGYIFKA